MAFATKFLCALSLLGIGALVSVYYVDNIYLPQRALIDEQQGTISGLQKDVQALKANEATEHDALSKRVGQLEALLEVLGASQPENVQSAAKAAAAKAAEKETARALARKAEATKRAHEDLKSAKAATNVSSASSKKWRDDHRCGKMGALPSGQMAQCNPTSLFPCCAPSGWCGRSNEHCTCDGCIDFRSAEPPRYKVDAPKRIALVVPFRDRGAHLEKFRERIQSHIQSWNSRGVKHTWKVYVVEQYDNQLFNRGYLFNVGFDFATKDEEKTGTKFDCVVMHDIDILPTSVVDYGWCLWPHQLSGEIECWGNSVPYPDNVGGVVSLSPTHWRAINGFSNEYDGWGGEDDDLYLRLRQNTLLKGGCHTWCNTPQKPNIPVVHRPPLGQGKMTCLHDGDHTPRQRAPEDAPMWQRLNAMKSNSKRWQNDGLTSLKVHNAGQVLESQACEDECKAPEDPEPKARLFSEHWSRVSTKPISDPTRVEVVRLPGSHGCGNTSRPLPAIPAGLEALRGLLPSLFAGHCDAGAIEDWAHHANFLLIDLTRGQTLLVGTGVELVQPDSSLPSLKADGKQAGPTPLPASEHLLQAQRLSRWLRKLPDSHRGWIVVADEAMPVWQKRFIDSGRREPLLTPACISKAAFAGGSKFRVTPGTKWCGDGGWNHVGFFDVLRSKTNVAKEKRVPICISFNKKGYAYRFENSETGCIGKHRSSPASWVHAQTIYTSTDARGTEYCVGVLETGENTRWILQKASTCNSNGFTHSFKFRAMMQDHSSALAPCCLLSASVPQQPGLPDVQRFALGEECEAAQGDGDWKLSRKLVLLSRRQSDSDHRICTASGLSTKADKDTSESVDASDKVFRVFRDSACDKKKLVTYEGTRKFHWVISGPEVYLPSVASGVHLCLCHIAPGSSQASNLSEVQDMPKTSAARHAKPFYTWTESVCPQGAKKELCFNTLGPADVLQAVELVDEVV